MGPSVRTQGNGGQAAGLRSRALASDRRSKAGVQRTHDCAHMRKGRQGAGRLGVLRPERRASHVPEALRRAPLTRRVPEDFRGLAAYFIRRLKPQRSEVEAYLAQSGGWVGLLPAVGAFPCA
jgi:hypothetical protein